MLLTVIVMCVQRTVIRHCPNLFAKAASESLPLWRSAIRAVEFRIGVAHRKLSTFGEQRTSKEGRFSPARSGSELLGKSGGKPPFLTCSLLSNGTIIYACIEVSSL